MDQIHVVDSKPWILDHKKNLQDLIDKREAFIKENNLFNDKDVLLECHNDSQLLEKLESFAKDSESDIRPYFLFNCVDERFMVDDPDCHLKMYRMQCDHAKKMISNRQYKVNYLSHLKSTRRELLMRHLALYNRFCDNNSSTSEDQVIQNFANSSNGLSMAAIVVVQMWSQPNKQEKVGLDKEVLFCSEQPLTDLRDQFRCRKDYGVPMDLSDHPEQQVERIFRCELFKSGFFLIEDTFFNDMRDPNNVDLSAPIIGWAKEDVLVVGEDGRNMRVTRGIGHLKSERMEHFKFKDINFRLGYPYLYSHQGNCEHLFTISDIRYVLNDINFKQKQFPIVTATLIGHKEESLKCYMCQNRPPHWYTRNNTRLPIDPYFFCEHCFHSFNYTHDKKKIGKFHAYLYAGAYGAPDSVVMNTNRVI